MKTLTIVYSYTGHSRGIAQTVSVQNKSELLEVQEVQRPGTAAAYTRGCLRAMRRECVPVLPLGVDLAQYEKIILVAPVWAGFPAPPFNTIVEALPAGRTVEVLLVSGSGISSNKAKASVQRQLFEKGCTLADYRTIKK